MFTVKTAKNLTSLEYHVFVIQRSSICNKCGSEIEQIFMGGEPIEIAKILSLINNTEKNQKIYNEAWRKHKCGI